jgi:ParB family transcriptional regulator, chromosome partitioning protein
VINRFIRGSYQKRNVAALESQIQEGGEEGIGSRLKLLQPYLFSRVHVAEAIALLEIPNGDVQRLPRRPGLNGPTLPRLSMASKTSPASSMAVLRDRFKPAAPADSPYRLMPVDLLIPDPSQPRSAFRADLEKALADPEFVAFVEHLRAFGRVTTPLHVRKPDPATGLSMIISGERRWRGAKEAGIAKVPVVISDEDQPLLVRLSALAENFFRAELPLIDRATYIQEILEETGCTQAELARQFGISDVQVSRYLSVLTYPEEILDGVREGLITDTETARHLNNADEADCLRVIAQARTASRPIQRSAAQRLASKKNLRERLAAALSPPCHLPRSRQWRGPPMFS